jgi:hypothetical protein
MKRCISARSYLSALKKNGENICPIRAIYFIIKIYCRESVIFFARLIIYTTRDVSALREKMIAQTDRHFM